MWSYKDLEERFLDFSKEHEDFDSTVLKNAAIIDEPLCLLRSFYQYLNFISGTSVFHDVHTAVCTLYAKLSHDIWGIYNCLRFGSMYQASTLVRSLFETSVMTNFIYQEFDKRADLYIYHSFIDLYKNMHKTSMSDEDKAYIIKMYDEHKDKYVEYKDWYFKEADKALKASTELSKRFKRLNLRSLSALVGMEVKYDEVYAPLSSTVHGTSLTNHFFIEPGGGFSSGPIHNPKVAATITCLTIQIGVDIFSEILSHAKRQVVPGVFEKAAKYAEDAVTLSQK